MKALTPPVTVKKATNCTGPEEFFQDQVFEIEQADRSLADYGGYRRPARTLTNADNGRLVLVTTQGGYRCVSFIDNPQNLDVAVRAALKGGAA